MSELYIGLISGTSVDGIDAALVEFKDNKIELIGFEYLLFPTEIKTRIQQLSRADALISLQDYGALDIQLGHLFAEAVDALLAKAGICASSIQAIGSHGQTVYHAPDGPFPFSLQIGDPNIIAEKTGITTVADLRRRDMAAGGQGAPLVPAFHQAVFSHPSEQRCILNIGGIANITVLPAGQASTAIGFDTGPGNTLMDHWIHQHQNLRYDENGVWANSGNIIPELIAHLKQDAYFQAPPPKSTGTEYFSPAWLEQKANLADFRPVDVQATLCCLTATTICEAIQKHAPETEQVLICGGGVHNAYLLQLIKQQLHCTVDSTESYGLHPDHVEAMAFAWLARQTLKRLPGNLKTVTGATHDVVLGGIYQGGH